MRIFIISLLVGVSLSMHAQEITKKPDFVQKNEAGEIIMRGIYTTDDSGYVVRYDLYDRDGKLTQTSIPYYARNGRLLESREYDADGKLLMVAVFIGERVIALDPEGKRIEKYDHQEVDMDGFLKHFRDRE